MSGTYRGEAVPHAKLTDEVVTEARRRVRAGESVSSLAREYGVSHAALGCAVRGTAWRHVAEPPATPATWAGVAVNSSVLTEDLVAQARRRVRAGESVSSLAREYGVSVGGLHRAVHGNTWKHVPEPPVRSRGVTAREAAEKYEALKAMGVLESLGITD